MTALAQYNRATSTEAPVDGHYEHNKDAVIMMVDDEPIMMELVEAFLEEKGYRNFIKVEHSTEALQRLRSEQPDLLLLDLNMPDVSGFDILQTLRRSEHNQHLPVIVLTSSSDAKSKLKALELGATDFLAKPVDASELTLRLRNALTVKAYQDRLEYYDALTGLPNRKLFMDRLAWALKRDLREAKGVVVMNIGLDRFKPINDSLGPKAGDALLKQVAERLVESVRETDTIGSSASHEQFWTNLSRLSGDEFCILFPGIQRSEDSSYIAQRILYAFEAPFPVADQQVYLTASIGIAHNPTDGKESDLLLKHAGAATAYAKKRGRNNYQFYSQEINARAMERLNLESDLRKALEQGEFELHYQPKVDASSNRVIGAEALLRWRHPQRGMVPPGTYIALAEETGLIVAIGDWVLEEACRQARIWEAAGINGIRMSVNVSAKQLRQHSLRQSVWKALMQSGLDPQSLVLEITESVVMEDIEKKLRILREIGEIGVSLSIDDFGTGYSSLSYLRQLPIDELKMDRSFLMDLPGSKNDTAIVKAIIALAQNLELDLIVEGVESREQLDLLVALGCRVIQGFYFSKELPGDQFADFVRMHHLQRADASRFL